MLREYYVAATINTNNLKWQHVHTQYVTGYVVNTQITKKEMMLSTQVTVKPLEKPIYKGLCFVLHISLCFDPL